MHSSNGHTIPHHLTEACSSPRLPFTLLILACGVGFRFAWFMGGEDGPRSSLLELELQLEPVWFTVYGLQ